MTCLLCCQAQEVSLAELEHSLNADIERVLSGELEVATDHNADKKPQSTRHQGSTLQDVAEENTEDDEEEEGDEDLGNNGEVNINTHHINRRMVNAKVKR